MTADFFEGRFGDSVEEYTYSEAFDLAEEVVENWDDYANAIVIAASDYYTKYEGSAPRIKEVDLEPDYLERLFPNFVETIRVTSVKYKADVADSYAKYKSCESSNATNDCWQLEFDTDVPPNPYVLVANTGYYRIKYVISEYNDLSDDLEDYAKSFMNAFLGVSQQEGNYTLSDDTADRIPGYLQVEDTATTKSESVTQSKSANFTVPDDLEISIDSNYSSFGNVFYSFLQYQYGSIVGDQFNLEQGTVEDDTGENIGPGATL